MTRDEAIKIRAQQLHGAPVKALVLQEAIDVIKNTSPVRTGRPEKFRLPLLTKDDRDRMNGLLLFNLGRLAGRAMA